MNRFIGWIKLNIRSWKWWFLFYFPFYQTKIQYNFSWYFSVAFSLKSIHCAKTVQYTFYLFPNWIRLMDFLVRWIKITSQFKICSKRKQKPKTKYRYLFRFIFIPVFIFMCKRDIEKAIWISDFVESFGAIQCVSFHTINFMDGRSHYRILFLCTHVYIYFFCPMRCRYLQIVYCIF